MSILRNDHVALSNLRVRAHKGDPWYKRLLYERQEMDAIDVRKTERRAEPKCRIEKC